MRTDAERLALLHGTTEAPRPLRPLQAGPLELLLDGIDLRYVRIGSTELLRRVYTAVRDSDWRTVPAVVSGLSVDEHENGFRIEFDARHVDDPVDFAWHGTITGDEQGGSSTSSTDGPSGLFRTDASASASITLGARRPGPGSLHALLTDGWKECSPISWDSSRTRTAPSTRSSQRSTSSRSCPRRRHGRLRLRGRPLGDGGSPELDRRQLQDVLDAARTRSTDAPRRGRNPSTARRHDSRRRVPGHTPRGVRPAVDRWT